MWITKMINWSGSVHHWLGENRSILLAVEINGRGSLYYNQNTVSDAHSVQPKPRFPDPLMTSLWRNPAEDFPSRSASPLMPFR